MPTRYLVKQGDTVIKLAHLNGLFPKTIWEHPDNAKLREKRADMNMLQPGDLVTIPDKREKMEKVVTTKRHMFRRKGIPAVYRLQIFKYEKPFADQPWRLVVDDGKEQKGTTDAKGVLQIDVVATAQSGELWVGPDPYDPRPPDQGGPLHYVLRFGHLDPNNEPSGVRKRLQNLGYDCNDPGEGVGPKTREALRSFQHRHGLKTTGEPDEATQQKLAEFHDKVSQFPPEPQ